MRRHDARPRSAATLSLSSSSASTSRLGNCGVELISPEGDRRGGRRGRLGPAALWELLDIVGRRCCGQQRRASPALLAGSNLHSLQATRRVRATLGSTSTSCGASSVEDCWNRCRAHSMGPGCLPMGQSGDRRSNRIRDRVTAGGDSRGSADRLTGKVSWTVVPQETRIRQACGHPTRRIWRADGATLLRRRGFRRAQNAGRTSRVVSAGSTGEPTQAGPDERKLRVGRALPRPTRHASA